VEEVLAHKDDVTI